MLLHQTKYEAINMKFSEKLKLLREEKGMTLAEFSTLLGTSKQVISRYERGENTPKITTVAHYAKVLNVSLEYLTNDNVTDKNGSNKKTPSANELTEGEQLLLHLFRQVPEDKQQYVLDMIRLALKTQQ